MTTGRTLADLKLTLVAILFIEKEERHPTCIAFLKRISHQELRLSDELLFLGILRILLNHLENERLHRYCDSGTCLITHEFEPGEVE